MKNNYKLKSFLLLLVLSITLVSCENEIKEEKEIEKPIISIITPACDKIVSCNIGGEEDSELCIAKYNSFYNSTKDGIYAYYMPIGEPIKKYLECINENTDCLDYQECYDGLMGITYGDICSDAKSECEGGSIKECKDGKIKYTDCSVINKTCLAYSEIKAICSNSKLCNKSNFENYCNDNGSLVYCNQLGYEEEYYCPYYDKECKTENNIVNCFLKDIAPSCEENNTIYCKDGNLTSCRENIELTTHCSLFGESFTCMDFSYPSGDFMKNVHGCFYQE